VKFALYDPEGFELSDLRPRHRGEPRLRHAV